MDKQKPGCLPYLPREKCCDGKVKHPTIKSAEIAMKQTKGRCLNVYQCPYCGKYHLGNLIKGK